MFTIIVSNFIVLCDFIILSSDFYVGLMENNQFIQKKINVTVHIFYYHYSISFSLLDLRFVFEPFNF